MDGLLDTIKQKWRGLLEPTRVPDPFDVQANALQSLLGPSDILPNAVGRITGSPVAELAAGFLSPTQLAKSPKNLRIIKDNDLYNKAKGHFGTTYRASETGYLLDDGTRLDLSGRHYGTGYENKGYGKYGPKIGQPDYLANSRNVDHRELGDLVNAGGWDGLSEFMDRTGAVRYMPNVGVSVLDSNMPSQKQIETIVKDFRLSGEPLLVDVDAMKDGSNIASQEFSRPTVESVLEFIRKNQKGLID